MAAVALVTFALIKVARLDGMNLDRWLVGSLVMLSVAAAAWGVMALAVHLRPINGAAPAASPAADLPGRAKIYLLSLALFSVLIIYGSVIPLSYQSLAWSSAVEKFRNLRFVALGVGSRSDFAGNILLFIPFSYLVTATLTLRTNSRLQFSVAVVAATALSAIFSIATQFPQLWLPAREASFNDVVANTIGGVI